MGSSTIAMLPVPESAKILDNPKLGKEEEHVEPRLLCSWFMPRIC